MTSTERNTWLSLFASFAVNAWFGLQVWAMYHDGTATAADGLQTWAQTMLWVIPASIAAHIGLAVLTGIARGMATGGKPPRDLKDERDRQFEFHGMGAMILCVVAGFLGAMLALAMGATAFNAFNLIYLSFFLGDIFNSLVRLGLYRFA